MKKELLYFLNCYVLNTIALVVIMSFGGFIGLVSGTPLMIVYVALIVAIFTTSASLMALSIWLKGERVFFVTKDTVIEDE